MCHFQLKRRRLGVKLGTYTHGYRELSEEPESSTSSADGEAL